MDVNPYQSPSGEVEPTPARPWVGAPGWRMTVAAVFFGAAVNVGGWLLAREGVSAPRRVLFAPVVVLGLQDMSDLLLGAMAGAALYAGYAGSLTLAKNPWSRLSLAIAVILFHVACVVAVESQAPTYAF